jgi:hypothetical protein
LELQQQLVLGRGPPPRPDEQDFDAGARKFFDEQNLMCVAPAQAIGGIGDAAK